MEQIANLSTGNRCQGSNPCLSAQKARPCAGLFYWGHDLCTSGARMLAFDGTGIPVNR